MKINQFIIGILFFGAVTACAEDKGNYDYTPLNDLTITGIEEEYMVERDSQLVIPVTITATGDFEESHYDYLWYIWKEGNDTNPDTLSHEKDLNVPLSVVAGDYELRYLVTDRESDVFYSARTEVSVIDDYSRGVMVLSNVDGEAQALQFVTDTLRPVRTLARLVGAFFRLFGILHRVLASLQEFLDIDGSVCAHVGSDRSHKRAVELFFQLLSFCAGNVQDALVSAWSRYPVSNSAPGKRDSNLLSSAFKSWSIGKTE